MYCLDTSFLIDLARNNPSALRKFRQIAESKLFVSSLAAFQFLYGVNYDSRREQEASRMVAALDTVDFGGKEAKEAAEIKRELTASGKTVEDIDILIAASAKIHRLKLVTRDKDFRKIPGLEVEEY